MGLGAGTMTGLSRVDIVTRLEQLDELRRLLTRAGVRGVTVSQVLGCGVEKGTREYETEENAELELLPQVQASVVLESDRVPELVRLIEEGLYTGHIGDGKIFVYDVQYLSRVRTGEENRAAL